jgi:hypothetical protein
MLSSKILVWPEDDSELLKHVTAVIDWNTNNTSFLIV